MKKQKYKNLTIYGLYTCDIYEQCVFVGNIHEIAEKFDLKEDTIRCALARKMKINGKNNKKYLMYKIEGD
jgi:DNA-binding transcriptional regulator PaaX